MTCPGKCLSGWGEESQAPHTDALCLSFWAASQRQGGLLEVPCSSQVFSGGGLGSQSGRPRRLRPCAHKHGARDRVGRREAANLEEVISARKWWEMTAGPNIFEHSDIKRCLKKMICVGRVGLGFYCISTIQALSGYIIYFCLFHLALFALFNFFF